ncbi:hypothetical protein HHL11_30560 [Ramlibacter sp. G-1-2-2]|uniref:DUF6351 domain-containing protein n=1 Tax=Ramlibacter agri TaxID=2728837 RepID=A0A848HFL9_9BURK|nr:hypothetical protein [Ramlibacter agri]
MARLLLQGALRRPRAAGWAGVLLLSCILAACGGDDDTQPLQLRTLSNRADLVSDGDVLMEIVPPSGSSANALKVTVGDRDVSSAFTRTSSGRILGLVTGLAAGNNTVRASASDAATAHIVVNNSPRSGPVLSGAQTQPFYCATSTPQAASGNVPQTAPSGLAGTADANCGIASETKLYYRTTAAAPAGGCSLPDPFSNTTLAQPAAPAVQCWKEYTPGSQPADMAAAVTTDAGVTVPFIVRVERGTMNRGIYDIAVLFDPSKPWTPTAPQAGWNGKVWYTFGASTGQPRRQVRPDNSNRWPLQEEQLKRGFLVAANSMTDSSRNSNRISMSETVMMMKEHVIDTYGLVKFTIGTGCSGGSINSNMNLSTMPGLLDGVITSCTYPDSETTAIEVGDCSQLVEAYQKPQMLALWTGLPQATINAKKAAINGHPDQTGCQAWFNFFGSNGKAGLYNYRHVNPADTATGVITQDATPTNNCELPNSAVYDPANPVATASLPRCNAWSWAESLWGKVPGSPAARETRDNTGVQYGLAALLNGMITPEEFVTLNEVVGGFDHDSTPTAARAAADSDALATAYRAGIVGSGKQLAKGAIIDLRGWDDSTVNRPPSLPAAAALGIHHQWFSWAIRERITRDAGDAGNQVLWRFAATGLSAPGTLSLEALQTMDQWLTSLVTAGGSGTVESRVRAAKPANARDFCILTTDATQSTKVYDQSACDADPFLKPAASPRQVAGGPRAEDILKCQLKPLIQGDYPAGVFTGSQFARLQAVFTGGVCDWTKAGVGQQAVASPLTFKSGPGGTALGNPPVSAQD